MEQLVEIMIHGHGNAVPLGVGRVLGHLRLSRPLHSPLGLHKDVLDAVVDLGQFLVALDELLVDGQVRHLGALVG